jgi:MFS family permease
MFPIGNLLPALALDRIGRRWTMIWGCAGLSICMMMLAALLSNGQKATASAAVTFFFLYMLIFGGTINVVPWGKRVDLSTIRGQRADINTVYGPEILPLEARTRGVAISVSAHWLWNFFIVMISPVLISRIGWCTYLIFMVLLALFIPVIYFFYPETSNLSLEDIDLIFLPVEMGGLGGNARIRMTPEMAAERTRERGMSKGDIKEEIEKAKQSEHVE